MLAHNHGQLLNGSKLGRSLGVSHSTIRRYLDILRETFMVRLLPPYLANTKKRQVKAPKIYIRDSGLLHSLLGIPNLEALLAHPIVGSSWEGFAIEQVFHHSKANPRHCFFWATHTGAELDLLVEHPSGLLGFAFRRSLAKRSRSMGTTLETLGPKELNVVYPGTQSFPLGQGITARPLQDFFRPPNEGTASSDTHPE
ncbi:MAG TPA: DUF4143 domain-containing protein [Planctomycetes bacterium]|nr:DUF4143 domain-containing protein [Planctomycetota bacterium]